MGRNYIESTPATRGEVEVDEDAHASLLPEGLSHDETVAALEAIAAELGYQLVPAEAEKPEEEPAGNASTEVWVDYAKKRGAKDDDLVDDKGKPLGQQALREKYGTAVAPPA